MKNPAVRTKELVLIALMSALIAVGAFITIPIPPVPFTLQIFFAMLSGVLLGSRNGAVSVGLYLLLGLCGVPVFTKGAGLSYLFQPTFGYLIGFAVGAWVCGTIIERRKNYRFGTIFFACLAGAGVDFAIGILYFYGIKNLYLGAGMSWWQIIFSTFLIFVPADTLLMALAALIGSRLMPILRREGLV